MTSSELTDAERLMKISTDARTQRSQERTEKYSNACKLAFNAITENDAQKFEAAAKSGHPGTYIYKWTLTNHEDTTYQFDGIFLTSLMKKSGLYYMLKVHYESSGYHFGWRALNNTTPNEFGIYVAWNKELFIRTFQKPYRKFNQPTVTANVSDVALHTDMDAQLQLPSFDGRGRGRGRGRGQFTSRGKGKGRGFQQMNGTDEYQPSYGKGRGGKGHSGGRGYQISQRKSPGLFDVHTPTQVQVQAPNNTVEQPVVQPENVEENEDDNDVENEESDNDE
jgi:hypothetical protein